MIDDREVRDRIDRGPLAETKGREHWILHLLLRGQEFGQGQLTTLVGSAYSNLTARLQSIEDRVQRVEGSADGLGQELKTLGAKRIVVDSVSLLNMLSEDEPNRRATLFSLAGACRASGATTLLTAEADPLHAEVSRDGLSEYVADGVVVLGYRTAGDGHRVGLALRVLKMRRTPHVRTVQPYMIGPNGLVVDAKAVDFGGP